MVTTKLDNFKRWSPELFERYIKLPEYQPGMIVRCPRTLLEHWRKPGCGSDDLAWGGTVYRCRSCRAIFADHQADPPHRRTVDANP